MDITIKNVSPDMAKAIELLASKADVACGPKIEVEVHEDAPKKYEPLGELKYVNNPNGSSAKILVDRGIGVAESHTPLQCSKDALRRLFFEHQTYKRYYEWQKRWKTNIESLLPLGAGKELRKIDADLDAGPQE